MCCHQCLFCTGKSLNHGVILENFLQIESKREFLEILLFESVLRHYKKDLKRMAYLQGSSMEINDSIICFQFHHPVSRILNNSSIRRWTSKIRIQLNIHKTTQNLCTVKFIFPLHPQDK